MHRLYTLPFLALAFILGTLAFFTPATYSNTLPIEGSFSTTWDTTNPGTSASNQITIPGTGAGYSYSIYWESLSDPGINGTTSTSTASSYTLTFPAPGQYRVDIIGTFPRIFFNNAGDRQKILTVEQWGGNAWTSMQGAFYGASNLRIPAIDAPDLSGVTSMASMFRDAIAFNDPVDHWNVSNINSMTRLFSGATSFNKPLNNWITSSLSGLTLAFTDAVAFNQPLSEWDVSGVTSMSGVFRGASSFNQPLSSWDVSNVTTFVQMFQGTSFNQDIGNWDVSSAETLRFMFENSPFNQSLNNWDVSNVTQLNRMFNLNSSFNQPLDNWDTSKVTEFELVFKNASAFNQDISMWNTASSTTMRQMFLGATAFNHSIASWNISSVTTMDRMFEDASLSQPNLDATLVGWAAQSVQSNVPLHIGAKTYSQSGAAALATLRDTYNWTITEQYLLTYNVGPNATLTGDSVQQLDSGANGTAVTVAPKTGYRFLRWSDELTTPTRTDTNITDNRTLTALIEKIPSPPPGTSAARQAQNLHAMGNTEAANALCVQFASACITTSTTAPSPTGTTIHPIVALVKPEYRVLMQALVSAFGW